MTEEELAEKLELIADMGDKQIEALADTLAKYFRDIAKRKPMGFRSEEEE